MSSLWLDAQSVQVPDQGPFPAGSDWDTVVVGAGLTGLTTAVLLARAGQRVVVIEARQVGAVATGNTTGKVSLLQGTNLSAVRSSRSDEILQAYVDGNREAQSWLLRYLEDRGVEYQRRPAYTYAHFSDSIGTLEEELEACQAAGVKAEWAEVDELPYPIAGAVRLADQAQIQPTAVLQSLATEVLDRGGLIFEQTRLVGAASGPPVAIETTAGNLTSGSLVLATGTPVLDRGAHFARMQGLRSYAQAFTLPSGMTPPQGMYLGVDAPGRSLRSAPIAGDELLVVGGNGHEVGRAASPAEAVRDLEAWTHRHFPGAQRTHAWSAQDYRPADGVPYFGLLPGGGGSMFVATGFNKWGMTNGVAAALAITSQILGGHMPWATTLTERSPSVSGLTTSLKDNASIGARMTRDWAKAELGTLPEEAPDEGQGEVGRLGGQPVGSSTVGGVTRRVSAVCPHLGGVLTWNDAECSWDCPLHASRFAPDGEVLEGPAISNLDPQ
ncbi:FAD-dependent oxidoreductase [Nesterenkonia haasae]|uniref:FAD-dependent oxidoreductase n=1 Tax=Nesterenkonia haasae TaxID=2587813 RepID=UPI0013912DC1|nr:FAD-dependent oxidoreductase [Nesterenkonia haasae]NDK30558.1 FAD-dependent oxidoreductase [Nesterenkonia haasae]